jgi:LEA14-like dessication related protein
MIVRGVGVGHGWLLNSLLAVMCLAPAGCAQMREMLDLQTPQGRVTGVSLHDVSLEAATLLFDVEVENPYAVPLPLANLDYSLASAGQAFLAGKAALQGTVPAGSTKTVKLPAKVTFIELLKAVKDVRPGSLVPYLAELGLSVDVPSAGPLRLPLKKEGKLPVPAAPEVEIKSIDWSKMTLDEAAGRVVLGVVNHNQFAVDLSKLAYGLSLGGVEVANSSLTKAVHFEPQGGAGTLEIPISFSPKKMGLAVFNLLTGQGSGYNLKGTMDVGTPFGPMSLPVEKIGTTVFRK